MKKIVLLLFLAVGMMAQAQMIGATNSQRTPRTNNSPDYRPTGSSLRFAAGFPMLASVAYDYQLQPWLMVGGGVGFGISGMDWYRIDYESPSNSYNWYEEGYSYSHENEIGGPCMPLFVEAELRTPRYKWSLFLNVRVAYNMFRRENYYYNGTNYLPDYSWYDWTHKQENVYHAIEFYTMAGVSYKNINFGVGYSTVNEVNITLSYNLPFTTIKKRFF